MTRSTLLSTTKTTNYPSIKKTSTKIENIIHFLIKLNSILYCLIKKNFQSNKKCLLRSFKRQKIIHWRRLSRLNWIGLVIKVIIGSSPQITTIIKQIKQLPTTNDPTQIIKTRPLILIVFTIDSTMSTINSYLIIRVIKIIIMVV